MCVTPLQISYGSRKEIIKQQHGVYVCMYHHTCRKSTKKLRHHTYIHIIKNLLQSNEIKKKKFVKTNLYHQHKINNQGKIPKQTKPALRLFV